PNRGRGRGRAVTNAATGAHRLAVMAAAVDRGAGGFSAGVPGGFQLFENERRVTVMRRLLSWVFGENGPITYYEWKLNSPWPGWLLALFILAAAAYVLFFYFRQQGLVFKQRIFWSALRIAAVLAFILLLL